jgi:hypothetical protein
MDQWAMPAEIEREPGRAGGALFENLRDGATVDQFLQWFPGVTRAQVAAVLEHEARLFAATAAG